MVKRRRWLALAVLGLVVAMAVAWTVRQPSVYRVSTTLSVLTPLGSNVTGDERASDPKRDLQNEIEFIGSDRMAKAVAAKLPDSARVQIEAGEEADVIIITSTGTDPAVVAETANGYADAYIDLRITEALASASESTTGVQKLLADLNTQIDEITEPIDELDTRILDASPGPGRDALEESRLNLVNSSQGRLDLLLAQQSTYRSDLGRLELRSQSIRDNGIQRLQVASEPSEPIGPSLYRNVLVGLVVGLVVSAGAVYLAEYFDNSIKTRDALEHICPPVLGAIPLVEGWKAKEGGRLVALENPDSSVVEAYRALRTSVKFIGGQGPAWLLHVTSPMPGEGKSVTVGNLGVVLARAGERVLMISGDLRRPRLESFFDVDGGKGLTTALLGEVTISDAVQPVGGVPGLFLLPTGELPPNPSEVLGWDRTHKLIEDLAEEFSIVLFDSPPVLPVTDALEISKLCDATMLVVRAGVTSRRSLGRCLETLELVETNLIGSVLNGAVEADDDYIAGGYRGYYGKHYGARKPTEV